MENNAGPLQAEKMLQIGSDCLRHICYSLVEYGHPKSIKISFSLRKRSRSKSWKPFTRGNEMTGYSAVVESKVVINRDNDGDDWCPPSHAMRILARIHISHNCCYFFVAKIKYLCGAEANKDCYSALLWPFFLFTA